MKENQVYKWNWDRREKEKRFEEKKRSDFYKKTVEITQNLLFKIEKP
jgi:hypothetical protein